jgi:hypothetical protein
MEAEHGPPGAHRAPDGAGKPIQPGHFGNGNHSVSLLTTFAGFPAITALSG